MKKSTGNIVYRAFGIFADCFFLSLLWILTSLPIVTVGTSSAALYHTMVKCVRNDRSKVHKEYFESFKANAKKGILTGIIFVLLIGFLVADILMMRQGMAENKGNEFAYYFFLVLLFVVVGLYNYVFPYLSRFEGGIREVLSKSAIMMVANIGWTLLLLAAFYGCLLLCNDIQFLFLVFPGGYCFGKSFVIERIFKKYMRLEDKERELEENRVYKE